MRSRFTRIQITAASLTLLASLGLCQTAIQADDTKPASTNQPEQISIAKPKPNDVASTTESPQTQQPSVLEWTQAGTATPNSVAAEEDSLDSLAEPFPSLPETRVNAEPSQAPSEQSVLERPFPQQPLAPDTVVSPTRSQQLLRQVGSSISVITDTDISNRQIIDVTETLRTVPGLDVTQSGGQGTQASVFIRGANAAQTKIVLDGIRVNNPIDANALPPLQYFLTDDIEQIEVLRGPQSGLYGSEAIGGVVSLTTKRGEGPMALKLNLRGGQYGQQRQYANLSGGNDLYYYSMSASNEYQNGFSIQGLSSDEPDAYRNNTVSGRIGLTPSENIDIDYVYRFIDARTDIDDTIATQQGANPFQGFLTRPSIRIGLFDGLVDQRVAFDFANFNLYDTSPLFPSFFYGQNRQVSSQTNFLLLENNTFTVGVDYLQEEGFSLGLPGWQSLYDRGIWLQDEIALFDRCFVTANYRWDDYSQAGPAETYRIAGIYHITETGSAVRGSYGTGFRAPTIFNLFDPTFGNPLLRPEESIGWDFGVEQRFFEGNLVLGATYFNNTFEDLIDFVTLSFDPFVGTYVNIGKAASNGVELQGTATLPTNGVVTVSYTYTDAHDLNSGNQLLRRPYNKIAMVANQPMFNDKFNVNCSVRWLSAYPDFGGNIIESFTVVNLAAWYQCTDNLRLYTRIDNLFNENYQEVFGFNTPGFAPYGGVELVWGGKEKGPRRCCCCPCNCMEQ